MLHFLRATLAVIFVLVVGSAIDAGANTTRQCSAEYVMKIGPIQNKIFLPGLVSAEETVLARFRGIGGCGNSVPNRCRRRARDSIIACAKQHYDTPLPLPTACTPQSGVYDYGGVSPFTLFVKRLCCSTPEVIQYKPTYFDASLSVRVSGDKGCGPKRQQQSEIFLLPPHQLNCANYGC